MKFVGAILKLWSIKSCATFWTTHYNNEPYSLGHKPGAFTSYLIFQTGL